MSPSRLYIIANRCFLSASSSPGVPQSLRTSSSSNGVNGSALHHVSKHVMKRHACKTDNSISTPRPYCDSNWKWSDEPLPPCEEGMVNSSSKKGV